MMVLGAPRFVASLDLAWGEVWAEAGEVGGGSWLPLPQSHKLLF